jgi:site-specific DNA-cytosine methylase
MEPTKTYNAISLFDGISAFYEAIKRSPQLRIDKYFSAEIESNALLVQNHHHKNNENFVQIGDVNNIKGTDFPTDKDVIFCAGFPCLSTSSIKKGREGLHGPHSNLFFQGTRILKELKKEMDKSGKKIHFIIENVASMTNKDRDEILSNLQAIYPETYLTSIDSALVSSCHRRRYYFSNIIGIQQPKDLGIMLQDVIESGFADKNKSNVILSSNVTTYKSGLKRYLDMGLGTILFKTREIAELSKEDKLSLYPKFLEASNYDGKPNKKYSSLDYKNGFYRLPTIKEYCRFLTYDDQYLDINEPKLSETSKVKLIGLSMTVDVIKHLLAFLPKN